MYSLMSSKGMTLGTSIFMFAGCFVNYSTYHNSSNSFLSFFPKGRVSFGEVNFLLSLFLRLALSIPTTAKEAGGLLGIQESSVLIVLLIISLLNIIVFPEGAGDFGELKMAFLQIILLSIPLLIRLLFILKWTGDCWGNSKFMFALIILCLIIALSIRSPIKGRVPFGEFKSPVCQVFYL